MNLSNTFGFRGLLADDVKKERELSRVTRLNTIHNSQYNVRLLLEEEGLHPTTYAQLAGAKTTRLVWNEQQMTVDTPTARFDNGADALRLAPTKAPILKRKNFELVAGNVNPTAHPTEWQSPIVVAARRNQGRVESEFVPSAVLNDV